jgi:ABC-2 type transport system permease protein
MTAPISVESPTGSIYDIGYRGYDGPRLGRAHAVRSLFNHSVRTTYGIGRGGRAKIAPFVIGGLAILPALALVGVLTLAQQFGVAGRFADSSPIRYDTYFRDISALIILFCAAQAPELFGRDQRHGVLSLYFARALRRSDYALARIGGFVVALLLLELFPQLVLFTGRALLSPDVVKAVGDDLPSVPPIVAQGLLSAALLGGLSMAVSAFTPKRAYATAGIIALFTIPGIVASVVTELGSSRIGDWLTLASPTSVLDGTNATLFSSDLGSEFFFVQLPRVAYFAAALVGIVGSIAITVRRFRRITA